MPFRSIHEVASTSSLADLFRQAEALRQLQQVVAAAVPVSMRQLVEVGAWHDGILVLYTPEGALATKLRNLLPSVLHHVTEAGWQVNEIFVRVQAKSSKPAVIKTERRQLPPQALTAFAQLADTLPASELKKSIKTMLRHHKPK